MGTKQRTGQQQRQREAKRRRRLARVSRHEQELTSMAPVILEWCAQGCCTPDGRPGYVCPHI